MADIDSTGSAEVPSSDQIQLTRSEIEHTRGDMAETLNAIKEKLDPKLLMNQARDTVDEVTTNLAEKAKSTVHSLVEDVSGHAKEAAHNAVTGVVDEAKDTVSNAVHSAQDAVGNVMHSAHDAVTNAVSSVKDKVSSAIGMSSGSSPSVSSSPGSSLVDTIKGNPVSATIMALGAALFYKRKRDNDRAPSYQRQYNPNRATYDYPGDDDNSGSSYLDQGKAKMGQAVDAVGDVAHAARDKAGDVIDSAKGAVGGAMGTVKNAGLSIIDTIERNPIPAAATALGLIWLYLKNQDENKAHRYESYRYTGNDYSYNNSSNDANSTSVHNVVSAVKDKAGQVGDAVGDMVDSAKDKAGQVGDAVGDMVDSAKDKAGRVSDAVGDAMGSARDKVGQVSSQVRDRAGDLGSRAMEQTRQTGSTIMRTLQENPLPVGMVALGIGAAVGMMMPETDRENQWMGEARDRFMDKAQDTAQDLAAKVKAVAGETLDKARDTAQHVARDQGLTGDKPVPTPSPADGDVAWAEPKATKTDW